MGQKFKHSFQLASRSTDLHPLEFASSSLEWLTYSPPISFPGSSPDAPAELQTIKQPVVWVTGKLLHVPQFPFSFRRTHLCLTDLLTLAQSHHRLLACILTVCKNKLVKSLHFDSHAFIKQVLTVCSASGMVLGHGTHSHVEGKASLKKESLCS